MRALNQLRDTGLTEYQQLKLEVFAEARKAKTADDFALALSFLSRTHVSGEDGGLVLDYIRTADGFSPNILVAKREHLTLDEAPFGAIALDFIGLGAENLRGTARALVEAVDLEDAVRRTVNEESLVTERFVERKRMVEAAAMRFFAEKVSVRFSGDDGVLIPEEEFPYWRQREFLAELSSLLPRPYFRMAVLRPQGASAEESQSRRRRLL